MSIVLNEYDWAEQMINNRNLGSHPYETLSRVARYYHENHYSKKQIRQMLDSFLLQCDPSASTFKWSDTLDRLASTAGDRKLMRLQSIQLTVPELETINAIPQKQERRLAFTLLCVSKYWDLASDTNNHWVNTKDSDLMKMANINTSIKRQSAMFKDLKDAGLIKFSKRVDNLNVQVLFSQDGECALEIHDFRNLGYQYLRFLGDDTYFECECCGITEKRMDRGRPPKYCKVCYTKIHIEQTVNAAMRRRQNYLS